VTSGVALANLLSLLFITPVVAFYLLRDWDRLKRETDSLLPERHAATIRQQLAEVDRTLAGFVRGQATVCLVLAAFYGIGLTVIGVDFGLAVGSASASSPSSPISAASPASSSRSASLLRSSTAGCPSARWLSSSPAASFWRAMS
jgi:Predicted permease